MNTIREIERINRRELDRGIGETGSWHADYKDSAHIFYGGLPYELTEGDIITIFSQYGTPTDVHLIRDKETGKSKGYGFLAYEDQRSTELAVDNFSGTKIMGRTIRVDHCKAYRQPKEKREEGPLREALGLSVLSSSSSRTPEELSRPTTEPTLTDELDAINAKYRGKLAKKLEAISKDDPMHLYLVEKYTHKAEKAIKKAIDKAKQEAPSAVLTNVSQDAEEQAFFSANKTQRARRSPSQYARKSPSPSHGHRRRQRRGRSGSFSRSPSPRHHRHRHHDQRK